MKRIGVDYSLTSPAVAVVTDDGAHFRFFHKEIFRIEVDSKIGKLVFEGRDYPAWTCDQDRYNCLANAFMDLFSEGSLVAMEKYAYGASGRVFDLAEAAQTFKHKLYAQHGLLFPTVAPNTLKKFATGHGHADKDVMAQAFFDKTGVWVHEVLGCKIKGNPASDCVDAFFAAEWIRNERQQGRRPLDGTRVEKARPPTRKRRGRRKADH